MKNNRSTDDSSSSHGTDSIFADAATMILLHQMHRLPAHIQETLRVSSCLGSKLDEQLLCCAMVEHSHNDKNTNTNTTTNHNTDIISDSATDCEVRIYASIHTRICCTWNHIIWTWYVCHDATYFEFGVQLYRSIKC